MLVLLGIICVIWLNSAIASFSIGGNSFLSEIIHEDKSSPLRMKEERIMLPTRNNGGKHDYILFDTLFHSLSSK